jgi:CheY-like chemotaxis protein
MTKNECKTILYVDDDADDREFLSEAIHEVNPDIDVILAENGLEALDYLNAGKRGSIELPSLVVLDLNMPLLDGKQTFERIKSDPRLLNLPVVIFTSSENPNDKMLFGELGIELITKPNNLLFMTQIASHMLKRCL